MKIKISFFLLFFLLFCSPLFSNETPKVVKGYLDLSKIDFSKDKEIEIYGDVEFFWKRLLTPSDFLLQSQKPDFYINIPGFWMDYKIDGKPLSHTGYGTYRFSINVGNEKSLGLRIPNADSNYRLWINGEELASDGIVGTTKETSIPHNAYKTIYFNTKSNIIEIVMQVSNFHYTHGGLWSFFKIGRSSHMQVSHDRKLALDLFYFGFLIMMALYHFGLFIFRKKDFTPLVFGIICFFVAFRTIKVGENFFTDFFQYNTTLAWEFSSKLEFISIQTVPGLIILFFYLIYPKDVNKVLLHISSSLFLIWSVVLLVTPPMIFFFLYTHFYQFVILTQAVYAIFICSLALKRKRTGSFIFIFGISFLFVTGINDILLSTGMIKSVYLASLGTIVFIFSQSFYLAYKFSLAYNENEKMAKLLEENNKTLEEKVSKRTVELKENMEKLKLMQENLIVSEKIASVGKLAGGIAHELNSPLGAVLTSVQLMKSDLNDLEDENIRNDFSENIETIEQAANKSKNIISKLLSQSEKTATSFYIVRINEVVDIVSRIVESDLNSKNIELSLNLEKNVRVMGDFNDLVKALKNLLQNSKESLECKKSTEKKITIKSYSKTGKIILEIEDNGLGMSDELKRKMFDPFFTTKEVGSGLGLGATVAYDILKKHDAEIFVYSIQNEFTKIIIEFKAIV